MGLYKIRPGSGKPLGGGYRPEWADYFGDERASLIKFGVADTPSENETLRRARCEAGHLFSVTERVCPRCAMARAEKRERAAVDALVRKLSGNIAKLRGTPGRCIECGEKLVRRVRGQGMQPRRFCSAQCRQAEYNARRRDRRRGKP